MFASSARGIANLANLKNDDYWYEQVGNLRIRYIKDSVFPFRMQIIGEAGSKPTGRIVPPFKSTKIPAGSSSRTAGSGRKKTTKANIILAPDDKVDRDWTPRTVVSIPRLEPFHGFIDIYTLDKFVSTN